MSTWNPINDIEDAIAYAEGFGQPGKIPTTSNNPGDLKNGNVGNGTTSGGITIYSSVQDGIAALGKKLQNILDGNSKVYSADESLLDFANTWTGGDNAASWASNVASALGITPQDSLSTYVNKGANSASPSPAPTTSGSTSAVGNITRLVTETTALLGTVESSAFQTRFVVGLIGLVFITAGIFSFDKGREVIVAGAKAAGELSA